MARKKRESSQSFEPILKALEQGIVHPVYIFHGGERFLVDRAVALLRTAVAKDQEDLAYETLRAGDVDAATIVAAARTVPMLCDQRLLVVRDAHQIDKKGQETLLEYIRRPVASTCLVLLPDKVDRRLRFYAEAERLGVVHEAATVSERRLPGWIGERARSKGLKLSPQAVEVLAETIGTNLSNVEDGLERLALYAGADREVTTADVEAVVASTRLRSVFDLTDALGQRNLAKALETLSNVLGQREPPLRLLATLATHVRRLLTIAELPFSVRQSPGQMAARAGMPPFVARKLADQVRLFNVPELRRAMVRLARADLELKSTRRPEALVMEQLIMDLCLPG